jgi:hypothetical protein
LSFLDPPGYYCKFTPNGQHHIVLKFHRAVSLYQPPILTYYHFFVFVEIFLYENHWVALIFAAHPYHDHAGEHVKESSKHRRICRIRATELSALRLFATAAIHRAFGVPDFSSPRQSPS